MPSARFMHSSLFVKSGMYWFLYCFNLLISFLLCYFFLLFKTYPLGWLHQGRHHTMTRSLFAWFTLLIYWFPLKSVFCLKFSSAWSRRLSFSCRILSFCLCKQIMVCSIIWLCSRLIFHIPAAFVVRVRFYLHENIWTICM